MVLTGYPHNVLTLSFSQSPPRHIICSSLLETVISSQSLALSMSYNYQQLIIIWPKHTTGITLCYERCLSEPLTTLTSENTRSIPFEFTWSIYIVPKKLRRLKVNRYCAQRLSRKYVQNFFSPLRCNYVMIYRDFAKDFMGDFKISRRFRDFS